MPEQFTLLFVKREQITENTYSFYFEKGTFTFLPGQYIRMILPHEHADERGTSRYFTISSSPSDPFVIITARVIRSTFKNELLKLKEGTSVNMFGPLGTFVLRDDENEELVFLSGGMGITPFHSMIRYAMNKKLTVPITLIASFSNLDNMLFQEELMQIHKVNKKITVVYLEKRISEEDLRKYIKNLYSPIYFLVGPPAMVETTRELLASLKIDGEKIHTENFTGY